MKRTIICLFFSLFLFTSCALNPNMQTPGISIFDFVSNPEYNKDCKKLNLPPYQGQADFMGIYAGKTTADNVKKYMGEPSKVFIGDDDELSWYYENRDNMYISVILVEKTVKKINVDNMSKEYPTLLSILEEYGCPSIIQLLNTSEDAVGYNRALITYPEIGIDFWFDNIKVSLTDIPSEIKYFKPITLSDYIRSWGEFFFFKSPLIEPVDWSEVVTGD